MQKKLMLSVISVVVLLVVGIMGFWPRGTAAADALPPVNVSVNSQQGIWVNGEGTVTVTPDIAIVNLGVSARASTVAEALAQASDAMNKIMAALTAAGIDPKDIQTSYFNIQQIVDYPKIIYPAPVLPSAIAPDAEMSSGSSGRIAMPATTVPAETETYSYRVDNTVTVKIRALDKVGTIIDAVAVAGGDLTRINGVTFTVEKPEQYYAQARQAAMNDAQAKAKQLAQLSDVTLGKAFYVSENSYPQPYYSGIRMDYAAGSSVSTPMSPGQTNIVLNVQVAYTIQ